MRHGYTEALAKRLERHNPSARLICEALVTTSASVKETYTDWAGADSLTGMTVLEDGGVKITGASLSLATNAVGGTDITDLDDATPWAVAEVVWGQAAGVESTEITTLIANLNNKLSGVGAESVVYWFARVYRVATIRLSAAGSKAYELQLLATDRIDAIPSGYVSAYAAFTFSFGLHGRAPLVGKAPYIKDAEFDNLGTSPRTIVMIGAMVATGAMTATNVAWNSDGSVQTKASGSHTINRLTLTTINDQAAAESGSTYGVATSPPVGVPYFELKANTYTQKTVAFTAAGAGNNLDIGGAPGASTKLRLIAHGQTPSDSALTFQIDDGVQGMTTIQDSDIIGEDNTATGGADLSSFVRQQAYDVQVTLDESTDNGVSPIARRFGIEEVDVELLDGLVLIGEATHELDPIDLIGNTSEIQLTLMRDGLRDYRDTVTTLLAENYFNALEFRIWVGHPDLARKDWLWIDDYIGDTQEMAGIGIEITAISAVARANTTIPPKSGSTRSPLVYTGQTLKAVYADILTGQINSFPTRNIGAMIESTALVTKTITETVPGKTVLNQLAYLARGGLIASQGRMKFVDMMADDAPIVVDFPAESIKLLSVSPGLNERIPDVYVPYGWGTTIAGEFADESYASVSAAITNLGRATIDRTESLDAEIAKWIPGATLADVISASIVQNFATGLILWTLESLLPYPYLEPGDSVAVETDRFVARDPHSGVPIRGHVWARGRIAACHNTWGTKFTVWIKSYADIVPTTASVSRVAFAKPAEILSIAHRWDAGGATKLSVVGNDATTNIYCTVGVGSSPADPTAGTNHGTVAAQFGDITVTGAGATVPFDSIVYTKCVAGNVASVLGTVVQVITNRGGTIPPGFGQVSGLVDDDGTDLVWTLAFTFVGDVNVTDHQLNMVFFKNSVQVDKVAAVAVTASQPYTHTSTAKGGGTIADEYVVRMIIVSKADTTKAVGASVDVYPTLALLAINEIILPDAAGATPHNFSTGSYLDIDADDANVMSTNNGDVVDELPAKTSLSDQVTLANPTATPGSSASQQLVIRAECWKADTDEATCEVDITFYLYEGASTVRATATQQLDIANSGTPTILTHFISDAEYDSITDHNDLRIGWTAALGLGGLGEVVTCEINYAWMDYDIK